MFNFSVPKVCSPLAVTFRGSIIIAGYDWKWDGEKIVMSIKWKD
jgi:hypothetical protein